MNHFTNRQKFSKKDIISLACLLFAILAFLLINIAHAKTNNTRDNSPTVSIKAIPFKKNGLFKSKQTVGFDVMVKNLIAEKQRGNLNIEIRNLSGTSIYKDNMGIYLEESKAFTKELELKRISMEAGVYSMVLVVNTNKNYSTQTFSFIVNAENINYVSSKPADFSTFWEETRKELAEIEPNFLATKRSDISTSRNDVYEIEYQSLDNQIIRSWLTVPVKNSGKTPVIVQFPDYVAELKPDLRTDVAVLSVNVRGIGKSIDNMHPDFYQYLTYEINNKKKYIYRGVYMDCLRALEFIRTNKDLKLDTKNIVLSGYGQGGSLAAVTASLDGNVKGLLIDRPLFIDLRDNLSFSENNKIFNWPANAVINFCNSSKSNGMNKEAFLKIWDYFDPINFAPHINSSVLMGFSLNSTTSPSQCNYVFMSQIHSDKKEIKICTDCENKMDDNFYGFQNIWLNETLF